jgi:NTP pyrophosphatase (non-canonical NTP hydrolase)
MGTERIMNGSGTVQEQRCDESYTARTTAVGGASSDAPRRRAVVISGSYRRGLDALRSDYAILSASCDVLSPRRVDFTLERDGFVFAEHEQELPPSVIEEAHVAAIRNADFMWLHLPEGYLGASGAFELGIAAQAGVPVFSRCQPRDVGLQHLVNIVGSPNEALTVSARDVAQPGAGVGALQAYYRRTAVDRGWSDETPLETLVLMTEELGELARAVRKRFAIDSRHGTDEEVAEELADLQLYVVHLANVMDLDLATAVTGKERTNADRFARSRDAA